MDIFAIRQQLRSKTIYEIPMRVTFYARVSSESDEQMNSLGNQIQFYQEMIRKNSCWEFVDGYVDEGLSAATTKRRENFHRMVEDAKDGLFDFILTKEITRFARNTLDSIKYTRELLSAGVGVFFQNDNINTLDEDSELRLTIMSGIAQDELRKLSSRVKFGHQQAIKNGVVLGNSRIFGYRKDNGRLVIDEDEAQMVRELFELYATGEYSLKQIEKLFWNKGYRNQNGNVIMHNTLSGMLSNPKYKGYYAGNKVKVMDLFTKKQKFLPEEEWVIFKDETGEIVPAIVSEEVWEQANTILKRRSADVQGRKGVSNHANLLTGKLFCEHCGLPYYRRESKSKDGTVAGKWTCSGKLKRGAETCPSIPIYESEIKQVLLGVFQETKLDADSVVEEYADMFSVIFSKEDMEKQIHAVENKIDVVSKKKQKLLSYNATGKLADDDFLQMNAQCTEEMKKLQTELSQLQENMENMADISEQVAAIKRVLKDACKDAESGIITPQFVEKYIQKIVVSRNVSGNVQLVIFLFTGECVCRYMNVVEGRMGVMSKKMNPKRKMKEFEIKRNCRTNDGHELSITYEAEIGVE